jgi:hypothetical protein
MRFSPIKPDNFAGDPLGYGGNFCGHFMIPALIAGIICDLWLMLPPVPWPGLQSWLAFGEFPHKEFLAALIVGVYMMVEIPQRGPAFDTFEDIAVIMAGLTCWVGMFSEIQAGDPTLTFDYPSMQWLLRGVAAWLLLGMAYRELQRRKDDA